MTRLLPILALAFAASASAAGLVWSLPEDGTQATYSGTLTQLVRRSDPTQQDATLTWNRTVTVRSVGVREVEYLGQTVPGRWLEIETVTGELQGGTVQAGPGGRIIAKVLVPEPSVSGQTTDEDGVPQSFLTVVEGYRQVDDGPVETIEAGAFDPSPDMTLLGAPPTLSASGESGGVSVGGRQLTGEVWTAEQTVESRRKRAVSQTRLTKSADAPFGVAAWEVRTELQEKQALLPRSEFQPTTESTETMELVEVTGGAVGVLSTP